jgi:hypothetical protein
VKRAFPSHVEACDIVMKACTDAVDALMTEMAQQHADIAEEARRMEEEEAAKRREKEMAEEEVRKLKARLVELGHKPEPESMIDIDEGEGEDELEDDGNSATEGKPTLHVPVRPIPISCFIFY